MTLEICIDSVRSAIAAEAGGANRLELCANLLEGGTTPSVGMLKKVVEHTNLPVMVIIRPRGGDFLYSKEEMDVMVADIHALKNAGAAGFVIGALDTEGAIDIQTTQCLVDAASGCDLTFHRAFDVCKDPFRAIDTLMELGIKRVLSSGQQPSALEGGSFLKEIQRRVGDKLNMMAGGGISPTNLKQLIHISQLTEYHATCRKTVDSEMKYRHPNVYMGMEGLDEFSQKYASQPLVRSCRNIMDQAV